MSHEINEMVNILLYAGAPEADKKLTLKLLAMLDQLHVKNISITAGFVDDDAAIGALESLKKSTGHIDLVAIKSGSKKTRFRVAFHAEKLGIKTVVWSAHTHFVHSCHNLKASFVRVRYKDMEKDLDLVAEAIKHEINKLRKPKPVLPK
ncbi:MAG TPA: hypothetical protein VL335_01100 [Candidatus Paceibacterota bacterium]|jgi:hypothetical protein|nr:hypothetical protein [Candidatus Paceibacterota bacterium]